MSSNDLFCRNYTDIADSDLDHLVREILELDKGIGLFWNTYFNRIIFLNLFSCCFISFVGLIRLTGCLLERGVKVPRRRIRLAYSKIIASAGFPTRKTIHRREYFVRSPLSLWHMDGNHTLIRYLNLIDHVFFII